MKIYISKPREFRVARVHTPDVTAERRLLAACVVRVIKVVVALRVCAKGGVIDIRRQGQRRTAAPPAYQFRGEQFPLFLGTAIRAEKSIEGTDARLILAKAHIGAVTTEHVGLRHR